MYLTEQSSQHDKDLTNINEDDKLLLSSYIQLLAGDQMFMVYVCVVMSACLTCSTVIPRLRVTLWD